MLLVMIAILVIVSGLTDGPHIDRLPRFGYTMVATGGNYGIVIDERFAGRFVEAHVGEAFDTWTPSRDDVAAAEELLRSVREDVTIDAETIARADSAEDRVSRTWYGATIDGGRLLFVYGYCFGGLPERPLVPVSVADGGACFWNATIDVEQWEVLAYNENGGA